MTARPSTQVRLPAAAVALLALTCAALAGVASGGSPWHSRPGTGPGLPLPVVEALAVGFGIALGGALLRLWQTTPATAKLRKRGPALEVGDLEGTIGNTWAGVRTASIVIVVVVALSLALLGALRRGGATGPPAPVGGTPRLDVRGSSGPAPRRSAPSLAIWFVTGLGGALAILGPPALLYRRRRKRPASSGAQDVVARVVREAIEDLEGEPDPRRAVVRAYVRMTDACAAVDVARQPDETPSEFMRHVLRTLRVSASPVERLTALFEEARFGGGPVGPVMKRDAIAALGRVCREIEA